MNLALGLTLIRMALKRDLDYSDEDVKNFEMVIVKDQSVFFKIKEKKHPIDSFAFKQLLSHQMSSIEKEHKVICEMCEIIVKDKEVSLQAYVIHLDTNEKEIINQILNA